MRVRPTDPTVRRGALAALMRWDFDGMTHVRPPGEKRGVQNIRAAIAGQREKPVRPIRFSGRPPHDGVLQYRITGEKIRTDASDSLYDDLPRPIMPSRFLCAVALFTLALPATLPNRCRRRNRSPRRRSRRQDGRRHRQIPDARDRPRRSRNASSTGNRTSPLPRHTRSRFSPTAIG